MSDCVRFPAPGCIVEFMEGNVPHIAVVTDDNGGKLHLLMPNRKESKLGAQRLLPWLGPMCSMSGGREALVRELEIHKRKRDDVEAELSAMDIWELAQGEVTAAPASWFAELFHSDPSADTVAAFGHVLLACKTHFGFQPPDFQVYTAETVEQRIERQRQREEQEAVVNGGNTFFRLLWDVACRKRDLSRIQADEPSPEVCGQLRGILHRRVVDPDTQEQDSLWRLLIKGLPDVPHLAVQLLMAWGDFPPHHNFWLDKASYAPGDDWWRPYEDAVREMLAKNADCADLPECPLPFLSIDAATTKDVDDAFMLETIPGGHRLTLALACPALHWPFGSDLDREVLHRGTSLYLPEASHHMLPEVLGTDAFSLRAGEWRPSLCMAIDVTDEGKTSLPEVFLAKVRIEDNLTFPDVQAVLDGAPDQEGKAARHADLLRETRSVTDALRDARIRKGAVIMVQEDVLVWLEGEGADIKVHLVEDPPDTEAHDLVAETMILASAAIADWAWDRGLPLIHRTQDVALPPEYAGTWTEPHDISRIKRALASATLEDRPGPHAALALERYAPITSPIRRYADLVNESQVLHMLATGEALRSQEEITKLVASLNGVLDQVGQVQRNRPRYWKLVYLRQMGDRVWWDGVITEETETHFSVFVTKPGLYVRGRRALFDERACPGYRVEVRIGKVHPLNNDMYILETRAVDA
ncbi:MAG: RNB domain-containing ribonuclease [Desulfovibrio sp.]|jgi:exoribonuclease-2|nr:RNB domain-containing ribonuclease [Desulfovibrio sp.]